MILGSEEIKKLIKKKKLIENYLEGNIQGAGVDVRVNYLHKLKSSTELLVNKRTPPKTEKIREKIFTIKPNEYFLVETIEKVNVPEKLCARILPRSTLHRCGIYLFTSLVDPGYKGQLIFGIKNLGKQNFKLERGAKIAQIIFEQVKGKTKIYKGRYQGGVI